MKKYTVLFFAMITTIVISAQKPDRTNPPQLTKPKNLELPPIQRFELSNGIKVLLLQKMNVPSVQVNLLTLSGSLDDPAGKSGLSSITFDLMDEGAGQYDALQLADEIDYLGARVITYSGRFSSGVNCSTPVEHLDRALQLMSDIVLRPRFSQQEIERIKNLRLNGLLQDYDEPTVIAARAFDNQIFGATSPYAMSANEQSIKAISKNDIESFHKTHIVSGNSTMIVVGAIDKQVATTILEKHFAAMPKGNPGDRNRPVPSQIKDRTIYIVDKPGAAQSVIMIGRMSESRSTKDYYDMVVLNTILGGSFTSRLNTNLREKNGYSYGARSGFRFWPVASPFVAQSSVQTDVTAPALKEFFNEFDNIRKPLPEDDLNRGKNYEALGYAAGFETNADIAGALADLVLYNLPDNYFNTYVENVLAVNKKGVESVAKKQIVPNNLLVVVVGDRTKIEEDIRKLNLGKVTILSVEDVLGKKPQLN